MKRYEQHSYKISSGGYSNMKYYTREVESLQSKLFVYKPRLAKRIDIDTY